MEGVVCSSNMFKKKKKLSFGPSLKQSLLFGADRDEVTLQLFSFFSKERREEEKGMSSMIRP